VTIVTFAFRGHQDRRKVFDQRLPAADLIGFEEPEKVM